jgi:hypothetical protein
MFSADGDGLSPRPHRLGWVRHDNGAIPLLRESPDFKLIPIEKP